MSFELVSAVVVLVSVTSFMKHLAKCSNRLIHSADWTNSKYWLQFAMQRFVVVFLTVNCNIPGSASGIIRTRSKLWTACQTTNTTIDGSKFALCRIGVRRNATNCAALWFAYKGKLKNCTENNYSGDDGFFSKNCSDFQSCLRKYAMLLRMCWRIVYRRQMQWYN
jgi:hypothetical protein